MPVRHEHDLPELGPEIPSIFFYLIILGLADNLPAALVTGLTAHGVPAATAVSISHLPPVSTLFAAFLGYNPAGHLLGPHVLSQLAPHQRATVTGERFFPSLITNVAFRRTVCTPPSTSQS